MNREIKFRGIASESVDGLYDGRVVNEGQMIVGHLVKGDGNPFIVGSVIDSCDEYISLEQWCPVRPETVSQFTGLKDKNGVEIYEGDVVQLYKDEGVLPVSFEDGCFGVRVNEQPIGTWLTPDFWTFIELHDPVTVIGNIYETPELLTGLSTTASETTESTQSSGEPK